MPNALLYYLVLAVFFVFRIIGQALLFVLTIALLLFPPFWVFCIVYGICTWLYEQWVRMVGELEVDALEKNTETEIGIDYKHVKAELDEYDETEWQRYLQHQKRTI